MSVWVASDSKRARAQFVQPDTPQFRAFALAVILLALVLLAVAGVFRQSQPLDPLELFVWVALVALAGVIPVGATRGPKLAMDLPLLLAAAFSFDPFAAGLVALAGSVDIREFKREISPTRAFWNRAQTALSVMAASLTFHLVGGLGNWPRTPTVALIALL